MNSGSMKLEKANPCRTFPSPDRKDKLRRLVWSFVNATIYSWIPTPFYAPRRLLLRAFGADIAPTARPYPRARIWAPWNLSMEELSCIANGVYCYNVAFVKIGSRATVSQGAFLCTASHDIRRSDFALIASEIYIAADAWVAAEAFIGPGSQIGQKAVVGARSVLNSSVADHFIVAGNPARAIGTRVIRE